MSSYSLGWSREISDSMKEALFISYHQVTTFQTPEYFVSHRYKAVYPGQCWKKSTDCQTTWEQPKPIKKSQIHSITETSHSILPETTPNSKKGCHPPAMIWTQEVYMKPQKWKWRFPFTDPTVYQGTCPQRKYLKHYDQSHKEQNGPRKYLLIDHEQVHIVATEWSCCLTKHSATGRPDKSLHQYHIAQTETQAPSFSPRHQGSSSSSSSYQGLHKKPTKSANAGSSWLKSNISTISKPENHF